MRKYTTLWSLFECKQSLLVALLAVFTTSSCDSTDPVAPRVTFSLSPEAPTLFTGSSIKLEARGDESAIPPSGPLKWSSSDASVVTVDATGVIRGVAPGNATIRAITGDGMAEIAVAVIPGGSTLKAGVLHACGIATDGLYCWGDNAHGQLGNGTRTAAPTPRKVNGGLTFLSVSPAWDFTCGITTIGAYCWGSTAAGQLGDGKAAFNTYVLSPVKVLGSDSFTRISSSGTITDESGATCLDATCFAHSCALTGSGEIRCWGSGIGATPEPLIFNVRFKDVSLGYTYSCGLDFGQVAYCWGAGGYRQSGPNSEGTILPPLPVADVFQSISASADHTCALSVGGDIYCWGANTSGQLGAPSNAECRSRFAITPCRAEPVKVSSAFKFLAVSVGAATRERSDLAPTSHTCAITTDLVIVCWGSNSFGELGIDSAESTPVPTPVASTIKFRSVTTGFGFTCGVAIDGQAYCWGLNTRGQSGNGSLNSSAIPTVIPGLSFK
jgi:alpha-tubulin suppressor-like RCC1 family protein